jgi:hypothetical protein
MQQFGENTTVQPAAKIFGAAEPARRAPLGNIGNIVTKLATGKKEETEDPSLKPVSD